ncbi:remorin 1.4-like [Cornus florida]|uniref:remorin 1.4-like n=1 Tax=Cornus florida TaxID=4283 RepID=UPI0028978135|nr:remorin 1.4-like [Cornus florida]
MESLIKKQRVRFSGVGQQNKEGTDNIKDLRIPPPQETESLKKERKNNQNWFWRQSSGQMNEDDSSNGGEYPTAVAAAAFAIYSLEESSVPERKEKSEDPATSLTKIKSKTQDSVSEQLSGKTSITNVEVPYKVPITAAAKSEKMPEKALSHAPPIKKTPTFADKHLNSTASTKPESAVPKPDLPSTKQSASPPTEIRRQTSTKPAGIGETEADAWETAEMAKIKERYDKSNTKIHNWQDKKKVKANREKDKRESKLEHRRAKDLQHYHDEMARIDRYAGKASAQAEANRRNEENKVKEKANKIRSTGKVPATCFCF